MNTAGEFISRRGTVLATFAQNGTYSAIVDMGGLRPSAIYADGWAGAAGSLMFRASFNPVGTGHGVHNEAGARLRVTPFAAGTFYQFGNGTWPTAAQYLILEVGTAGTIAAAAGGTIVVVGEV